MLEGHRSLGEQGAAARAPGASTRALPPGSGTSRRCPARPRERELVARFTDAFEAGDIAGVVALLTEDAC